MSKQKNPSTTPQKNNFVDDVDILQRSTSKKIASIKKSSVATLPFEVTNQIVRYLPEEDQRSLVATKSMLGLSSHYFLNPLETLVREIHSPSLRLGNSAFSKFLDSCDLDQIEVLKNFVGHYFAARSEMVTEKTLVNFAGVDEKKIPLALLEHQGLSGVIGFSANAVLMRKLAEEVTVETDILSDGVSEEGSRLFKIITNNPTATYDVNQYKCYSYLQSALNLTRLIKETEKNCQSSKIEVNEELRKYDLRDLEVYTKNLTTAVNALENDDEKKNFITNAVGFFARDEGMQVVKLCSNVKINGRTFASELEAGRCSWLMASANKEVLEFLRNGRKLTAEDLKPTFEFAVLVGDDEVTSLLYDMQRFNKKSSRQHEHDIFTAANNNAVEVTKKLLQTSGARDVSNRIVKMSLIELGASSGDVKFVEAADLRPNPADFRTALICNNREVVRHFVKSSGIINRCLGRTASYFDSDYYTPQDFWADVEFFESASVVEIGATRKLMSLLPTKKDESKISKTIGRAMTAIRLSFKPNSTEEEIGEDLGHVIIPIIAALVVLGGLAATGTLAYKNSSIAAIVGSVAEIPAVLAAMFVTYALDRPEKRIDLAEAATIAIEHGNSKVLGDVLKELESRNLSKEEMNEFFRDAIGTTLVRISGRAARDEVLAEIGFQKKSSVVDADAVKVAIEKIAAVIGVSQSSNETMFCLNSLVERLQQNNAISDHVAVTINSGDKYLEQSPTMLSQVMTSERTSLENSRVDEEGDEAVFERPNRAKSPTLSEVAFRLPNAVAPLPSNVVREILPNVPDDDVPSSAPHSPRRSSSSVFRDMPLR